MSTVQYEKKNELLLLVCQSKYFFLLPLNVEEEMGAATFFFFAPFDASIFAEAAPDATPPAALKDRCLTGYWSVLLLFVFFVLRSTKKYRSDTLPLFHSLKNTHRW